MWKYECKRHLLYVGLGMLVGALIFGLLGWQQEFVQEMLKTVTDNKEILTDPYLPYMFGALMVGSLVNGMLLLFAIIRHFNLNFLFVAIALMLFGSYIGVFGFFALLPTIVVCLYGWATIPNRKEHNELTKNASNAVKEAERIYRLHHVYDEANEELGDRAWKIMLRVNILYFLGIVGLFLILLYVEDFMIVMLAGLIFMGLFYQLTKYKNSALQPIISLLYDQCDPEACATAIFALARKAHKKKTFPLTQQLAQCMIYLNDPHLAIDILAIGNTNRHGIVYPYYTLMGYAYYLLGDQSMVEHQKNECERLGGKANTTGPMGLFRQQAIESINTKLLLMNQEFDQAKLYYQRASEVKGMAFQEVDTNYYLGLISFVQQEFYQAQTHFEFVSQHGNKIYFKQKADEFLATIETLI